ncbi:hypothetical protein NEIELOOT_01095 [Neisseria elongata subsp. glycolytica ATCC 29315]|uniref:Uncharacterized protein n=1 Tax=Neisseria elongata subsp. glycolytica ATCC 29315 TaxID=546263 RepID=D4DPV8_NEIEG|nr:hypothetical protein NEIELOOT_01095 [Neisseria elongata subsp. glycolytica ATCC 29315]
MNHADGASRVEDENPPFSLTHPAAPVPKPLLKTARIVAAKQAA